MSHSASPNGLPESMHSMLHEHEPRHAKIQVRTWMAHSPRAYREREGFNSRTRAAIASKYAARWAPLVRFHVANAVVAAVTAASASSAEAIIHHRCVSSRRGELRPPMQHNRHKQTRTGGAAAHDSLCRRVDNIQHASEAGLHPLSTDVQPLAAQGRKVSV